MKNIYYIVLIPLAFVAGLLLHFGFEIYRSILLVSVALLISFLWLYQFGTFRYSRAKPMLILIFIMFFGGLTQMSHAGPRTKWLVIIPVLSFLFIYFIHYFRKPVKKTIDHFKMLLIVLFSLTKCNPFIDALWWLTQWLNYGYVACVLICLMLMIAEMKEWSNWLYVNKPPVLDPFRIAELLETYDYEYPASSQNSLSNKNEALL